MKRWFMRKMPRRISWHFFPIVEMLPEPCAFTFLEIPRVYSYLSRPVFAHGQLDVALSRARDPAKVYVLSVQDRFKTLMQSTKMFSPCKEQ
jgi:hypothetical protein